MAVDQGDVQVGKKVVVVGAGLTGTETETAVYLAQSGHAVTLIDKMTIAQIDNASSASLLIAATLRGIALELGNEILENTPLCEVTNAGIVVKGADGLTQEIL